MCARIVTVLLEEVNKYTTAVCQLMVITTKSEFDQKWKRIKEEWDIKVCGKVVSYFKKIPHASQTLFGEGSGEQDTPALALELYIMVEVVGLQCRMIT